MRWIYFALSFTLIANAAVGLAADPASTSKPPITAARAAIPRHAGDPLAVRAMNPVFDSFPDSSLVDFSFLLDPPAGKDGFVVRAPDGTFRFEKSGKRARFWGFTVAATHAGDVEKPRIELVTDVMARAGCNLLRLHELDNRGGEQYNLVRRCIIDEAYPNNNRSTEFDPEYRDRVDWWIACAQKRGMYVYLVVRAYRTFREGDGVPNADKLGRAAKPYAFFDPHLIELQKKYAEDWLFKHVNPYTGIPNGLNPAVCMLEIENEDSLFFGHVAWREFVEPYRTNFQKMWNDWLRERYSTTDKLRQAWTNARGECPLGPEERLENGTVELPDMSVPNFAKLASMPWTDKLASPARTRDGVRFAEYLQERYFATTRDFLREKGAKMPLCAVVNSEVVVDTFSTTRQLDATAENAYLDHPSFLPGAEWVGRPFYSNKNYLREVGSYSLAAHMARYRWSGSPLVCREWTQCWPNEYRVTNFPDMASLGLAQDYDMLIHFAYYTWGDQEIISAFGPQADPVRWGLNGYAATMFLRGDLPTEQNLVRIAYTEKDLSTWASYNSPLHALAWDFRLENWFADDPNPQSGGALLTITSGRSGTGKLPIKENLLLYDARYRERREGRLGPREEGLLVQNGYDQSWIYAAPDFPVDEIRKAGFTPIGVSTDSSSAKAFFDPTRKALVCAELTESSATALARNFAHYLAQRIPLERVNFAEPTRFELAQGAIVRDTAAGVLTIAGERTAALAGEFQPGQTYRAGSLEVVTSSPVATVIATSLDGKPLAQSRRFAVKMATVARNRGQQLDPVKSGPGAGKSVLIYQGSAPVQTAGKPSDFPTTVKIGDRVVAQAYLVNGTWEVVYDLDAPHVDVFCDTPNVRFVVDSSAFGEGAKTAQIRRFFTEYPPELTPQRGTDFIYPGFSKYVRLEPAGQSPKSEKPAAKAGRPMGRAAEGK